MYRSLDVTSCKKSFQFFFSLSSVLPDWVSLLDLTKIVCFFPPCLVYKTINSRNILAWNSFCSSKITWRNANTSKRKMLMWINVTGFLVDGYVLCIQLPWRIWKHLWLKCTWSLKHNHCAATDRRALSDDRTHTALNFNSTRRTALLTFRPTSQIKLQ